MSKAILYFLAAGAAGVGGPAAAAVLFRLGRQEAAAHTLARGGESSARLLRIQIDLAPLASRRSPSESIRTWSSRGYRDMRDGLGHGWTRRHTTQSSSRHARLSADPAGGHHLVLSVVWRP